MSTTPDPFLRESDAFSWYMERDPIMRSTIVAVAWLADTPDWDVLLAKLDRASRTVPLFRTCTVEAPVRVSTPRRVTPAEFDLSWHVRRVAAPPPHTDRTVIDLARVAAMTSFDPTRPLWEFTLVEHLNGHRSAFIMKVHHSLTDGVGGMQLALELFDVNPEATMVIDPPEPPAVDAPGPAALVREGMRREARRTTGFLFDIARTALPATLRAVRNPLRTATEAVETTRSIARMVAPVSTTLSPIMTGRGLSREVDMLTVSLADFKRAARSAGGTVNDGFLAAVTGGLRRYHERHGTSVAELRMTLPINMRAEGDPAAGNRITLQRFTLPVAEADPAARMPEIDRRCRAILAERALPHSNAIAGVLNLLPHDVVGGMLKHVDFVASDVPGIPFPVYLAGAEMTGYFAFGPTIGAAVNFTLLSYNGVCCVGVTMDRAAVPDPGVFMTCLVEGFEEVLSLGGSHAPAIRPLQPLVLVPAAHDESPPARHA